MIAYFHIPGWRLRWIATTTSVFSGRHVTAYGFTRRGARRRIERAISTIERPDV